MSPFVSSFVSQLMSSRVRSLVSARASDGENNNTNHFYLMFVTFCISRVCFCVSSLRNDANLDDVPAQPAALSVT